MHIFTCLLYLRGHPSRLRVDKIKWPIIHPKVMTDRGLGAEVTRGKWQYIWCILLKSVVGLSSPERSIQSMINSYLVARSSALLDRKCVD